MDKVKNGLSYELPKLEKAVLKNNKKPEVVKAIGDPNEKPKPEKMLLTKTMSDENKKQNFDNPLLDADISWANSVPDNLKNEDKTSTAKRTETGNGIRIKSILSEDKPTKTWTEDVAEYLKEYFGDEYNVGKTVTDIVINEAQLEALHKHLTNEVKNMQRPNNIGKGLWAKQVDDSLKWIDDMFGKSSKLAKALKGLPAITIGIDTLLGINDNIKNNSGAKETVSDAGIDIVFGAGSAGVSGAIGGMIGGMPGVIVGILAGLAIDYLADHKEYDGKTFKQRVDSWF